MPRCRPVIANLLWIDGCAAALAGSLCLLLSPALAQLHALPQDLLQLIGAVNLLYAAYSFSLAIRARRPRPLIALLVIANSAWALVCLGMAASFAGTASIFGIAHLLGEAIVVAGLAGLEWKWRARLLRPPLIRHHPAGPARKNKHHETPGIPSRPRRPRRAAGRPAQRLVGRLLRRPGQAGALLRQRAG